MSKAIFDGMNNEGNVEKLNIRKFEGPSQKQEAPKEDFQPVIPKADGQSGQEANITAAMNAINTGGESSGSGSTTSELTAQEEEMAEITEEEEELAEQMLFNGYAQKDIKIDMFKKREVFITLCTTTPQEMSVVNNMIYDKLKSAEDDNGTVDMPEVEANSMKGQYMLAISFIGINGEDIAGDKATATMNVLKAAIKKLNEFQLSGDLDKAESLEGSIRDNILYRLNCIRQIPTQMIDFIGDARYRFETNTFALMQKASILPKS